MKLILLLVLIPVGPFLEVVARFRSMNMQMTKHLPSLLDRTSW